MRFWTTIGLLLVLSIVGLTYEIAAGRVLAPFFGTSLITWTAVIASVLAGFSLGNALGGLAAEGDRRAAFLRIRRALVATSVLMALSPAVLAFLHAAGARGTGGMLVTVLAAFFPASVLVSFPTPFLAKLAVEARPGREGSSLGIVLAAGSLGAIFGAIFAGFAALPLLGSAATFSACGAASLLCVPFLKDRGDPEGPCPPPAPGTSGFSAGTRPDLPSRYRRLRATGSAPQITACPAVRLLAECLRAAAAILPARPAAEHVRHRSLSRGGRGRGGHPGQAASGAEQSSGKAQQTAANGRKTGQMALKAARPAPFRVQP
ncbi:fused MFS/spermidine synthase [Mangrovicoccus ximenensis]|uniref:fused MFS/spermidine synthase n=1 Tax=Mangrovicoccus ximenensis TaxID=1911570 RepID=UPI00191C374A|nr:fused MFS/spermidine synthase [Mangrovicoccus ximenensis]